MIVYEQAIDEMFGIINTAITEYAPSLLSYTPAIYWPGELEPEIPDSSKFWFRVRQTTLHEAQITLRTESKRYTSYGQLLIILFVPKRPELFLTGRKLARLIRDSFRQASGGSVIYRYHRVKEEIPEDAIQQFTVIINYEFDEEI